MPKPELCQLDALIIPSLSSHAHSPDVVGDWDVPLSGSEDESLVFAPEPTLVDTERNILVNSIDHIAYKRPTGIKTLAEWGGLKFPPKVAHGGLSFRFVLAYHKDYCRRILNRQLKKTYLVSFQQYLRAMENSRRVAQKRREIVKKGEKEKDSDKDSSDSDRSSSSSSSAPGPSGAVPDLIPVSEAALQAIQSDESSGCVTSDDAAPQTPLPVPSPSPVTALPESPKAKHES